MEEVRLTELAFDGLLDTADSPPTSETASRTVSLPVCGRRVTCSPLPAKSVMT
jgi:hypothetical protein